MRALGPGLLACLCLAPGLGAAQEGLAAGRSFGATAQLGRERAEQFLLDAGFRQVRVRHHGDTARIEVAAEERTAFFQGDLMEKVYEEFRKLGFTYAALDLRGYRTGSMHEGMKP